jgi:hypothetical protein
MWIRISKGTSPHHDLWRQRNLQTKGTSSGWTLVDALDANVALTVVVKFGARMMLIGMNN